MTILDPLDFGFVEARARELCIAAGQKPDAYGGDYSDLRNGIKN